MIRILQIFSAFVTEPQLHMGPMHFTLHHITLNECKTNETASSNTTLVK